MAGGILVILAALPTFVTGLFFTEVVERGLSRFRIYVPYPYEEFVGCIGPSLAALVFFVGVLLLTAPEHYPPADVADASLRRWLRYASAVPLIAAFLLYWQAWIDARSYHINDSRLPEVASWVLASIGCIPLPLLIFYRLRGLAKRARSAHLAEHCVIVGIGASASLLYFAAHWLIEILGDRWFSNWWSGRSNVYFGITLVLFTAASLFSLWSIYLLIRFALAFNHARRRLRRKWRTDDRSTMETA